MRARAAMQRFSSMEAVFGQRPISSVLAASPIVRMQRSSSATRASRLAFDAFSVLMLGLIAQTNSVCQLFSLHEPVIERYSTRMEKALCPKCKGAGQIPLSDVLLATLIELRRTPGFTASEFIDRFPGVGVTAINNRLEDLRGAGYARRERNGHTWRYYPTRPTKRTI